MAASNDDTEIEKQNWHWRNSMRTVRFFNFDGRAAFPLILLLFHFRWSTIFLTIVTLFFFHVLEKRGLTFPAALRSLRVWLVGYERSAWLPIRKKKMRDYG